MFYVTGDLKSLIFKYMSSAKDILIKAIWKIVLKPLIEDSTDSTESF